MKEILKEKYHYPWQRHIIFFSRHFFFFVLMSFCYIQQSKMSQTAVFFSRLSILGAKLIICSLFLKYRFKLTSKKRQNFKFVHMKKQEAQDNYRLLQCFLILYYSVLFQTRMQSLKPNPNATYKNILHAIKCIIKREGLFAPLRGINIVALGSGPAHALYFSSYEYVKKRLNGNNPNFNALSYGRLYYVM